MQAFLPIDYESGSDLSVKKLHKINIQLVIISGENNHE